MPGTQFKKLQVLLTLLAFSLPFQAQAVTKVVFTTEPQTIKPGEPSGTISIQLQDDSGVSTPATETMDLEFASTSSSGSFISPSSTSAVTKTISTGSANKNFRYQDSNQGNFTLSLIIKGRNSGETFSTSQVITVSNTAEENQVTSTTTTEELAPITTTSSAKTSSVHYSATPLSTISREPIKLSAGRDHFGVVGNPIEFEVDSNIEYTGHTSFVWNFGDGSIDEGERVVHIYQVPGQYQVILNANVQGRGTAVSRSQVFIDRSSFEIVYASGDYISIKNNSNREASLYGYALWSQGNYFIFPQDTIVSSGGEVGFSSKVTNLYPGNSDDVALLLIGAAERNHFKEAVELARKNKINEIVHSIEELRSSLNNIRSTDLVVDANAVETPNIDASDSLDRFVPTQVVASPPKNYSWLNSFKRFIFGQNDE